MNIRQCPSCNHRKKIKSYFIKDLFKPIWSNWECEKCGSKIRFNYSRRILISILSALWLYVIFILKDMVNMTWYWFVILLIILLLGEGVIFSFDTFVLYKKSQAKKNIYSKINKDILM